MDGESLTPDGPPPGPGLRGTGDLPILDGPYPGPEPAYGADLVLLASMGGPAGPGVGALFGQDGAADTLPPGPVLGALTAGQVARAACRNDNSQSDNSQSDNSLNDDELTGALQAARRLACLADYQQTVLIAEFARRRQAQFTAARAAGKPAGCRDGEFPGEELAMELMETAAHTGMRIDTAVELTTRLPRTLAGMARGSIDLRRAMTIAARTLILSDSDAAYADEVLAAVAPDKRPDQLERKAAALEMKLAPDAVRARKEQIRRLGQRVEARREASGNASLSGRELTAADVVSSKAYIDDIAARLRDSGLVEGTIGCLQALALADLTQGRDPLDRIKSPAGAAGPAGPEPADRDQAPDPAAPGSGADPAASARGPEREPGPAAEPERSPWRGPGSSARRGPEPSAHRGPEPGAPGPLPALINLLVPASTLLGQGTAPAQAAGWGLFDSAETRALVEAAARHPRTRWCVTVTAPDGTAVAHGCAAGRHPWPDSGSPPKTGTGTGTGLENSTGPENGTGPPRAAPLLDLLRRLSVTLSPVARDSCDHAAAENRYTPSRRLRHLLRARSQTCTAPGCSAQAVHCDNDHTVPYPGGPTCACNLNPKCRRHHRTKQAPGWIVTQPAPDTAVWTTPAGRTHVTGATSYDL